MKNFLNLLLISLVSSGALFAQQGYQPTEKNLENREWFQNAKFGLFIHWGVYSEMAGGGDMGISRPGHASA